MLPCGGRLVFDDALRKMRDSERKVVEKGQEIERIREDEEATSPPLVGGSTTTSIGGLGF